MVFEELKETFLSINVRRRVDSLTFGIPGAESTRFRIEIAEFRPRLRRGRSGKNRLRCRCIHGWGIEFRSNWRVTRSFVSGPGGRSVLTPRFCCWLEERTEETFFSDSGRLDLQRVTPM